jgi:hypothetical protein
MSETMDRASLWILPQRARPRAAAAAWLLAAALPMIGLVSLLLRRQLDPHFENYSVHFVVFGFVGAVAFILGYAAGEAAKRRGDGRVLLLSLAFMATGGFMGLHALGTQSVLFTKEYAGFQVAIPVGLLVAAVFAAASAFVDIRADLAPWLIRRRTLLRTALLLAMAAWFAWTLAELPPLGGPNSEAARGSLLAILAAVGTVVYAISAARYWYLFRGRPSLLPAAVIGCFILLSEALIGVALTGERQWHASWWEWHALIVAGYVLLDRDHPLPGGFGVVGSSWGKTMLHEMTHAVGLGHAAGAEQLMYPTVAQTPADFGAGDLTGLTAVGAGQGCFPLV